MRGSGVQRMCQDKLQSHSYCDGWRWSKVFTLFNYFFADTWSVAGAWKRIKTSTQSFRLKPENRNKFSCVPCANLFIFLLYSSLDPMTVYGLSQVSRLSDGVIEVRSDGVSAEAVSVTLFVSCVSQKRTLCTLGSKDMNHYRIIESFWLVKTFEIIDSNHHLTLLRLVKYFYDLPWVQCRRTVINCWSVSCVLNCTRNIKQQDDSLGVKYWNWISYSAQDFFLAKPGRREWRCSWEFHLCCKRIQSRVVSSRSSAPELAELHPQAAWATDGRGRFCSSAMLRPAETLS